MKILADTSLWESFSIISLYSPPVLCIFSFFSIPQFPMSGKESAVDSRINLVIL